MSFKSVRLPSFTLKINRPRLKIKIGSDEEKDIIKFVKRLQNFYRRHFDIVSKYSVGLKRLLLQGLSEPEFYGDFVDVLRQTECLVVNPIKVNSFAYLFNCTTVDRDSD